MKKYLAAISLLAASLTAPATTLNPVQLLNPAGSTAGQVIVSTGASTAPAWGTVTAGILSPVAANTVVANVTSGTASPTAFAMPSCSTSTSAIQYTTNTGFTCFTGLAPLASPAFTGTVTTAALTTTGAFTPSQTAGIVGTTTNNSANAGSVGEYVTATGSGVSMTTGTATNITSISLSAGDWDVSGLINYQPTGGATPSQLQASVSTSSAAIAGDPDRGISTLSFPANNGQTLWAPTQRIGISSTTTVYLVGIIAFTSGTTTASGRIRARRVR